MTDLPNHSGGLRNVAANSQRGQHAQKSARVAANFRRRIYSLELLNLGVQRSKEIGPKAASEELGIGYEALRKACFVRRIEKQGQGICAMKRKAANGTKYTLEQKRAVVRKAYEIRAETAQPIRKCFISAGRMLNANGCSIMTQFNRGLFAL